MNKLAKQLIAMGHKSPELRPHLTPILDKIAASSDLVVRMEGSRPVYRLEDLQDASTGLLSAQETAFKKAVSTLVSNVGTGRIKKAVESMSRIILEERFEVKEVRDFRFDPSVDNNQNWAEVVIEAEIGGGPVGDELSRSERNAINSYFQRRFSVDGELVCVLQDYGVTRHGAFYMIINFWGALWDNVM